MSYRSVRPPPLSPTELDKTPTQPYYCPGSPESPEVPQPFFNYNYDRIQNDLLDEICDEIGIKDATDLDFMDFEPPGEDLLPRGPMCDEMDNLDQLILFGQMDQNNRQVQPDPANQSQAQVGMTTWQGDGDQSVPDSPYHTTTPIYGSAQSSPISPSSPKPSPSGPAGYPGSPNRSAHRPGSPKPEPNSATWKQVPSPKKPPEVIPPDDFSPEDLESQNHMTDDYKIASPRKNRVVTTQPSAVPSHHDGMLRMAIAQDRKNTCFSSGAIRNPPSVSDGASVGSPVSPQDMASPGSQPPRSPASHQEALSPACQPPASPVANQSLTPSVSHHPRSPVMPPKPSPIQRSVSQEDKGRFAAPEHLPPGKERSMLRAKSTEGGKRMPGDKLCGPRNQESPFDQGYFSVGSVSGSHDGSNNDVPANSATPPLTLDQQSVDDKVLHFLNNADSVGDGRLAGDMHYRNMMTDDALLLRAKQIKQERVEQAEQLKDDKKLYYDNKSVTFLPQGQVPDVRPNMPPRGGLEGQRMSPNPYSSQASSQNFLNSRMPNPPRTEMSQGMRMGSQGFVYKPTDASINFTTPPMGSTSQGSLGQQQYMTQQGQFSTAHGCQTSNQGPQQHPTQNQNLFTMPSSHSTTPSANCAPYPRTYSSRSGSNPSSPKKQRLNYHPSQYTPTTPVTFNQTPAQFAAPSYNNSATCRPSGAPPGGQGTPMYRMGGQPTFRPQTINQGPRSGVVPQPLSSTNQQQNMNSSHPSHMFAPMSQQSGQSQMGMPQPTQHTMNRTMPNMAGAQFQPQRQSQGQNFPSHCGVQPISQPPPSVQHGPQSHMTPGNFAGMPQGGCPSTPQGSQNTSPGGTNSFNQLSPGGLMGGLPPGAAKYGFMQQLISDRSNAFRSHPLFPLLRDLIIADMNFASPTFPFQLIANLPVDFDKLLSNYFQRNPLSTHYEANQAVEKVIMDALRYAHKALIGEWHSCLYTKVVHFYFGVWERCLSVCNGSVLCQGG